MEYPVDIGRSQAYMYTQVKILNSASITSSTSPCILALYTMSPSSNLLPKIPSTSRLLPVVRRATLKHRRLQHSRRSIVTVQCEEENIDPSLNFQIFDIFDAPSRLGESGKILARSMSSSSTSLLPSEPHPKSSRCNPSSRQIEPLPAPIIFDGPARPRHIAMMSYRVGRDRSSPADPSKSPQEVSRLPDPILFDGPSRLRPYIHSSSTGDSQSVRFIRCSSLRSKVTNISYSPHHQHSC